MKVVKSREKPNKINDKIVYSLIAQYGTIPAGRLRFRIGLFGVLMQNEWLYIGLFLIVGVALPAASLIMAAIITPKKSNPIKNSTYECGMETVGDSWVQFKAQYYIFGLVFLIFEVPQLLATT